jgi:hypothetical protein
MRMIANVSSRNENDDGGCVLALIDLTSRLAKLVLRRMEIPCAIQAQDKEADTISESQLAAVDCCQMTVRKEGVAFVAIPKHASFYVETAEIPTRVLRRAASLL